MLLTKSLKLTLVALTAVLIFGAASAAAANEIEGVWSFEHGSVAIESVAGGETFQGTVVAETQFGACTHPVGEVMWTGMAPQPDGSFHGFHQWFSDTSGACAPETPLGPTAWRVLHTASGVSLKVCFSHPGTSQPEIAPDGTATETTFNCSESKPLAPLSTVEGEGAGKGGSGPSGSTPITFSKTVVLPPAVACVSQSSLKIKLKDPQYDPLKEVLFKIGGKQVADIKGIKALTRALKKGITLKNLPGGAYKISVIATTVLKQKLTGSQTYKACTTGSGKIKLKKAHTAKPHA